MTFGANAGALVAPFKGAENNAFQMGMMLAGLQNQIAANQTRTQEVQEVHRLQLAQMQLHLDTVMMGEPTTHTALYANTQHT